MGNNSLNKPCSGKGECFYLSYLKDLEKNPMPEIHLQAYTAQVMSFT